MHWTGYREEMAEVSKIRGMESYSVARLKMEELGMHHSK